MALGNLDPVTREETILNGDEITPANRGEYFLQKAVNKVPTPGGNTDAGKIPVVNSAGNGYGLEDIPEELPAIASGDAGKVLTVNAGETGVEWAEAGGGITAVCKFSVYWDDNENDEVVECDKSYSELSAILTAADAPVYSEIDYYGVRFYSPLYSTDSTVDQYIGSPIRLVYALEHMTQGRVAEPFDAFVGRLSDNTAIILFTPTA